MARGEGEGEPQPRLTPDRSAEPEDATREFAEPDEWTTEFVAPPPFDAEAAAQGQEDRGTGDSPVSGSPSGEAPRGGTPRATEGGGVGTPAPPRGGTPRATEGGGAGTPATKPARTAASRDATEVVDPPSRMEAINLGRFRIPLPGRLGTVAGWVRNFLDRHGDKLWWLHSLYALGLGVVVMLLADKGLAYSRFLIVSLGVAWIVLIVFFRLFGTGEGQQERLEKTRGGKLKFFVMTYVLKNMYQGMLFFVLPFYWKSASFDSPNRWFVIFLCVLAFISTMDVVFDRVLMRFRALATAFYAFTLFACLNLIIPTLLPDTAVLTTMSLAAGLTIVAFWLMHVPLAAFRHWLGWIGLASLIVWSVAMVHVTREVIPPVPMHVSEAAVGPKLLRDGRLAMQVSVVHASYVKRMHAVTDVVVPGGVGDRLYHVWRHEGEIVATLAGRTRRDREDGLVRLRSKLSEDQIPEATEARIGHWSVDVMTADGQIVGRLGFEVIE